MSERTAKTKTWTEWTFTTAEFLEKLGIPPDAGIISVHISLYDRQVIVTAPGEHPEGQS